MSRSEFNDFQKEVNEGVEAFWQAAQAKRGRVMGSREVMLLAAYISGMTEGIMELQGALQYKSNLLAAYIEEYGDTLAVELAGGIIEGEVVDSDEAELSDVERQEIQADGLDTPQQEEE